MAGFDFETVWAERRIFRVGEVELPVARLSHIVESKRRAGRDKDRLFLVTHAEAIRDLSETDRLSEPKGPRASHKGKGQAGRRRPSRGRRPRS